MTIDRTRRLAYIEQIKRDMAVLKENPIYHVPSRRFYEDRIQLFRAALKPGSPSGGATGGQIGTTRPTPKVWVRLRRKSR